MSRPSDTHGESPAARDDHAWMRRALERAERGRGAVEPNPMVGCVLVRNGQIVGEGWHQRIGGPHAEVEAIGDAARRDPDRGAADATAYVTLEPCSHHGRTPPCADALIDAKVARVVAAMEDPFSEVSGQGLRRLREAGIQVDCGMLESDARRLNAPYLRRLEQGRPWVIAKWAMTLDGKISTAAGDSQWISNEASRRRVHQLRGRVDAILVGSGTVLADDPQLTARPPGPRTPLRVACDRRLRIPLDARLLSDCQRHPTTIAALKHADAGRRQQIEARGAEVLGIDADDERAYLESLLAELGRREMTNVLVEGGAQLLGSLFDFGLIDEVWCFVAAKIAGGAGAPSPVGGRGLPRMAQAALLGEPQIETLDGDVLIRGRIQTST